MYVILKANMRGHRLLTRCISNMQLAADCLPLKYIYFHVYTYTHKFRWFVRKKLNFVLLFFDGVRKHSSINLNNVVEFVVKYKSESISVT